MKRLVLAVGLVIFLASGAVLGESEDCGCPNQATVSRVEALQAKCEESTPGELPEPEVLAEEAMEWQCIVVDIIIEYVNCETRPCDIPYGACLVLCDGVCGAALVAACGAIVAQGLPVPPWCIFAGAPCLVACPTICRNYVPWCEYCETKVTKVYSCGWVFTE